MGDIGDGIEFLMIVGAFFAVLAIAAVVAVAVSWFGYPTASLWITGAGAVGGYVAARFVRSRC